MHIKTLVNIIIIIFFVNIGICSELIELKKKLKNNPDSYSTNYNLGSYYEKNGNYNQAIKYLKKSIEIDKKKVFSYILLGSSLDSLGNYKESVKTYKLVINIDPKNDLIYSMLAMSLTELNDFKGAIKYFKKSIKLNKKNQKDCAILFGIGNAYVNIKNYEKAIKPLEEAVIINPKLKNAVMLLGLSYNETGKTEKAFDQYIKLQEIDRELSVILLEYLSRS
ncbi:MAG: tetratricopeptide repeat protein [Deltaproteobacteria bacterium]|nr:tetratricopeptide repeat protein [Deltaproteobacteria bacterium]